MTDYTAEVEARLESRTDSLLRGKDYGLVYDIRAALEEIGRLREIKEYAERTHEEMRIKLAEAANARVNWQAALAEVDRLTAEVDRLREALEDIVDGAAVTFEDERISYEEVQLGRGALARARAALRGGGE